MNNLETLKNELIEQKHTIENMGGRVIVSAINPSPKEITAGIKTISGSDLTDATATEKDVLTGKTFYAGDNSIKTGSLRALPYEDTNKLVFDPPDDEEIHYTLPEVKALRPYLFYHHPNKLVLTLPNTLEKLGDYSLYYGDITITNFNSLTNIKHLGKFSLMGVKNLDLANLPSSITYIDNNVFYNTLSSSNKIVVPSNLTFMGNFNYTCTSYTIFDSADLSQYNLSRFGDNMFRNCKYNNDAIFPDCVIAINKYFNHSGGFNNVYFPPNLQLMEEYSFSANYNTPDAQFTTSTFVFSGLTPPQISSTCFHEKHFKLGARIYVPDNALEAYRTADNFKTYANYILPMSEKP